MFCRTKPELAWYGYAVIMVLIDSYDNDHPDTTI